MSSGENDTKYPRHNGPRIDWDSREFVPSTPSQLSSSQTPINLETSRCAREGFHIGILLGLLKAFEKISRWMIITARDRRRFSGCLRAPSSLLSHPRKIFSSEESLNQTRYPGRVTRRLPSSILSSRTHRNRLGRARARPWEDLVTETDGEFRTDGRCHPCLR